MKKFKLESIYNEERPLSWSALSSFKWNKSQWHDKYVIHGKCRRDGKTTSAYCTVTCFADPSCPVVKKTPELLFGSFVDEKLQNDSSFLPLIPRYEIMQHEMRTVYDGIPLVGYADTASLEHRLLRDYKTGRKAWDQKRADETGQITCYLAMIYLINKIRPEDFRAFIDWMPTRYEDKEIVFMEGVPVITIETRRTMKQALEFFSWIKVTWREMEEYCRYQESLELKTW